MPATFAQRLKESLTRKGWSQTKLAEEIGVTPTAVSSWVSGSRRPNLDRVIELADILDVSVGFLLGRELSPSGTGNFDPYDPNWRSHPDCPALLKTLGEDESFDEYLRDPDCRSLLTGIAFMRGTLSKDFVKHFLEYARFLNERDRKKEEEH